MKKNLLPVVIMVSCASANAYAENLGLYIQGNLHGVALSDQEIVISGIGRTELEYALGGGAGGAAGYRFPNIPVRAEAELVHRTNDVDESGISGEFESLAGMINGYYDFKNVSVPIIPYVGGGIGVAKLSPNSNTDDTVFAYQMMAGISYPFNKRFSGVLGYRFFATSEAEYNISGLKVGTSYNTHNVDVGLRVGF